MSITLSKGCRFKLALAVALLKCKPHEYSTEEYMELLSFKFGTVNEQSDGDSFALKLAHVWKSKAERLAKIIRDKEDGDDVLLLQNQRLYDYQLTNCLYCKALQVLLECVSSDCARIAFGKACALIDAASKSTDGITDRTLFHCLLMDLFNVFKSNFDQGGYETIDLMAEFCRYDTNGTVTGFLVIELVAMVHDKVLKLLEDDCNIHLKHKCLRAMNITSRFFRISGYFLGYENPAQKLDDYLYESCRKETVVSDLKDLRMRIPSKLWFVTDHIETILSFISFN